MSSLQVAAGIVERADGQILLAQRPEGKTFAGLWEFPGGKFEPGESGEQTLARELQEELQIEIRILRKLGEFNHVYNQNSGLASVCLHVYVVHTDQSPRATPDVQNFKWIQPEKVDPSSLVDADSAPLLAYLKYKSQPFGGSIISS